MNIRLPGAAALATATLLGISPAQAQTPGGIALNQLDPAPAGDAFFGVASPFVGGHLVPRGLVMFDYAVKPLTVSTGSTSGAVVASQAFLHVGASLALFDRLLLSVAFPASAQTGPGVSSKIPLARASRRMRART
jgi:hypothetical protein